MAEMNSSRTPTAAGWREAPQFESRDQKALAHEALDLAESLRQKQFRLASLAGVLAGHLECHPTDGRLHGLAELLSECLSDSAIADELECCLHVMLHRATIAAEVQHA